MTYGTMKTLRIRIAAMAALVPALASAQQYPEAAGFPACTAGFAADSGGNGHFYCGGPADITYNVTFEQVGFKRSDGTMVWIGGNKTFNVASAAIGGQVAAYLSGIVLPNGTYTEVHAVLDLNQTVQGSSVAVAGTSVSCSTRSLTKKRGFVSSETCSSLGIATPYGNNVTPSVGCVDGTFDYAAGALSPNLVVTGPSSQGTISVTFDVSRGVLYDLGTAHASCTADSPGKFSPTISTQ
ncbi:MAG TPA: hypothetical protein VMQ11_04585 [Alphaproteobacteria bacterium]|nr:hypothetical protein [Alphaproteobacteria bacterium]